MRTDRHEIFRELEPPPGGAARLRTKLAASRRTTRPVASWLGAVAVAVAVVAALTVWVLGSGPSPQRASSPDSLLASAELDRLLGREPVPYELSVRRGDEPVAVSELETREPRVRLYHLEAGPAAEPPAPGPSP